MATTSISGTAVPADHGLLARLVVATFVVLDAADFPYLLLAGDPPEGIWLSAAHRVAGLVACLSLLWGWRRTAIVSGVATASLVAARQEITGFELWWLLVALALGVSRRAWGWATLTVLAWGALAAWSALEHGRTSAVGVAFLCLLGAGAGAGLGFVGSQRAAADARRDALLAENERLRRAERRLLAGDLRAATEGLFSHARSACARSLASSDPDELRRALGVVRDDACAALASLRRLLSVLRTDDLATRAHPEAEEREATALRTVRLAVATPLVTLAVADALGASGLAPHPALVAALLAAALACVRPRWGTAACLVVLVSTLGGDVTAWVPVVTTTTAVVAVALASWHTGWRVAVLLVVLLHPVVRVALGGPGALHDVVGAAGGVLVGVLVALAVRDYLHVARRSSSDQQRLASERGDIAPTERAALARELHDQLGHQLSLVALQVNAVERVDDPARLRHALGRVDSALDTAAEELAVLLALMDAAPASGAATAPLVVPCAVGRLMADKLVEHGHPASVVVDPAADELDPTTRLTVVRVLQEATTNALRHADPESPVEGRVRVSEAEVSVVVRNPVPTGAAPRRLAALSTGYGLRGVRERAEVSGGSFSAGVVGDDWCVSVTLPVAPARGTASVG